MTMSELFLCICFIWILIDILVLTIEVSTHKFDDFTNKHTLLQSFIFAPCVIILVIIAGLMMGVELIFTNRSEKFKYFLGILLSAIVLISAVGGIIYYTHIEQEQRKNDAVKVMMETIEYHNKKTVKIDKKIQEYNKKLKEKEEQKRKGYTTQNVWIKSTDGSHLKYYEPYDMITDPTSKAYEFQQRNDVNEDWRGFLMEDNEWYAVAMGEYFGDIGTKYIFTLDTGNKIKVVIGDRKADIDTCKDGYLSYNGHILEFMINPNANWMIDNDIVYHGTFSYYDKFKGSVVKIERVIENVR